jgi:hypothetical protein
LVLTDGADRETVSQTRRQLFPGGESHRSFGTGTGQEIKRLFGFDEELIIDDGIARGAGRDICGGPENGDELEPLAGILIDAL